MPNVSSFTRAVASLSPKYRDMLKAIDYYEDPTRGLHPNRKKEFLIWSAEKMAAYDISKALPRLESIPLLVITSQHDYARARRGEAVRGEARSQGVSRHRKGGALRPLRPRTLRDGSDRSDSYVLPADPWQQVCDRGREPGRDKDPRFASGGGPVSFVGRVLRGVRAGEHGLLWNSEAGKRAPASIELVSDAFDSGASIPRRHAGDGVGANLSPPLAWRNIPRNTAELALVIEDADAPLPRPFVHAVVTAISPEVTRLAEGTLVEGTQHPGVFGKGSFGGRGYLRARGALARRSCFAVTSAA